MGSIWSTGSGVVFRRSAINDIGGWPFGSLCEDVLFSFMLLSKGYKTAYVHEQLQTGLVPDSMAGRKFKHYYRQNHTHSIRFETEN
jgi:cellulose synthase/poly-beta-1,6-N-acetylglucosamine synthase-like glycosyltransferase